MSDEKPKATKWEVTRFILLWIFLSPFVLFREEIEAVLAVLLVVAALAGFFIPLTLKRMQIDPALAGGVVLTTVTDVIGYMAFLGLGAALLL